MLSVIASRYLSGVAIQFIAIWIASVANAPSR